MERIINGKIFNTKTATWVCDLSCRAYPGDFHWHETLLYLSQGKQFFLAGRGGPASMWAEPAYGGGCGGGSGIRLVTNDEAREIMEREVCATEDFQRVGFNIEEG